MLHFVCTKEEARALARAQDRFWVSNCGCRERKGDCARSRTDLCLYFRETQRASGSGIHEVSREFVDGIFREVEAKRLVPRPFREADGSPIVAGICFCCDDCCGYFLHPEEPCDRGARMARTDIEACTDCLDCTAVCHFQARRAQGDEMIYHDEKCYGCGLCAEVCPTGCIEMVARA